MGESTGKTYDSVIIGEANRLGHEWKEWLMIPEKIGVYLSKKDVLLLSDQMGAAINLSERKKMLEGLFKFVDNKEDLNRLLDLITRLIQGRIAVYQKIRDSYRFADEVTDAWITKATDALETIQGARRP